MPVLCEFRSTGSRSHSVFAFAFNLRSGRAVPATANPSRVCLSFSFSLSLFLSFANSSNEPKWLLNYIQFFPFFFFSRKYDVGSSSLCADAATHCA